MKNQKKISTKELFIYYRDTKNPKLDSVKEKTITPKSELSANKINPLTKSSSSIYYKYLSQYPLNSNKSITRVITQ